MRGVRQGVHTTSVGARGKMGVRGSEREQDRGSPTTSVGARGEMGVRGSEGSEREQDRGSPPPLWGLGVRWE